MVSRIGLDVAKSFGNLLEAINTGVPVSCILCLTNYFKTRVSNCTIIVCETQWDCSCEEDILKLLQIFTFEVVVEWPRHGSGGE